MAKLTKKQIGLHTKALELLERDKLKQDDRRFILYNWRPDAGSVTHGRSFFTPDDLASTVYMHTPDTGRIVDLGAGIGRLSWGIFNSFGYPDGSPVKVTCIEINPEFVAVGKKVLPEATWIQGDIFDLDFWKAHWNEFDPPISFFIANPPFGGKFDELCDTSWLKTKKSGTALAAIEVGLRVSRMTAGVGILPQTQCKFDYSGQPGYSEKKPSGMMRALASFHKAFPQLDWGNTSYDTTIDRNSHSGFEDTPTIVEIVRFGIEDPDGPDIVMPEGQLGLL